MPDYQELYVKLFRATEEAIQILIAAQRECEELYISSPGPDIKILTARGPLDIDKTAAK